MFTIKKVYDINSREVIDFVRLIGRFGLKFRISEEFVMDDPAAAQNGKPKDRYRRFTVFGTFGQIRKFNYAREMIYEYLMH